MIEIRPRKPMIKISVNGVDIGDFVRYLRAFDAYLENLEDAVFEKLPRIVEECVELGEKAISLKDNAAGDFASLNDFSKAIAVAKTVKLITEVPKIPAFVKKTFTDLQASVKEIEELCTELKDLSKIAALGKKCADAKKFGVI